ncbi:PKS-NRPS hybrid synthetase cheA-like [Rutidosis leptorrhynchoides]|uniref:PKS-NRPS hybrid synthetase cheA-like n=1 Tax=Rutidosis leptorrhynchoides TaxID=125765 RepID=UPI003A9A1EAA
MNSQVNNDEKLYLESSKFQSRDELVKNVRAFYFNKGFGLSICNSKKDTFVILKCDRGGSYRDRNDVGETRKRSTVTHLIDCPFKIEGRKGWDGMWIFRPKCLNHNHEQSSDISGHSLFRRLPADSVESVKDMTKSGIPPRQILCSLRQRDPNLPTTSRTIYNLNAKVRRENLGNRSMIDALFEELQVGGFWYDILYDQQGHITSFFLHTLYQLNWPKPFLTPL